MFPLHIHTLLYFIYCLFLPYFPYVYFENTLHLYFIDLWSIINTMSSILRKSPATQNIPFQTETAQTYKIKELSTI